MTCRQVDDVKLLPVSVVYALPHEQHLINMEVEAGCTAGQAISLSGIKAKIGARATAEFEIGIYGERVPYSHVLVAHDRVEIYRALLVNPREQRRLRAKTPTKRKR